MDLRAPLQSIKPLEDPDVFFLRHAKTIIRHTRNYA